MPETTRVAPLKARLPTGGRAGAASRSSGPSPQGSRTWTLKGGTAALRAEAIRIARNPAGRGFIIATFACLLVRQTMAAPIRAYLPAAVWYAPDGLVGLALIAALVIAMQKHIPQLLIGLLALAGMAGLSLLQNPLDSVALSLRQFLYLGLAILVGFSGAGGRSVTRNILIAISAISILGIAYDAIYGVPWKGLLFQGALATKAIAREWWSSGGVRRLAGFCLSSTDSSVAVAGGMVLLAAMRGLKAQVAFWLLAGPAVWAMIATTQKAAAASFCVVVFVIAVTRMLRPRDDHRIGSRILRAMAIAALVATMLTPIVLYKVPVSQKIQDSAPTLVQRMDEVWPTVIDHLTSSPQSLFGYGFGAAADTATDQDFQLVDNAFLFSTVTIGLLATLAVFGWVIRLLVRLDAEGTEAYGALALITLLCINCVTANMVMAGGTGSLYLGFAIGVIGRPRRQGTTRMLAKGVRSGESGPVGPAAPSGPLSTDILESVR